MKKLFLMLAMAFSVAAVSCTKDCIEPHPRLPDGDCGVIDPKPSNCEALTVDNSFCNGDYIIDCIPNNKIKRAWIEGNDLKIELAYSGCNQHEFDLLWNGIVNESLPVQVTLDLLDNTGEQMCLAYFQHTVCFDISKLRSAGSKVIIHLNGYTQQLEY